MEKIYNQDGEVIAVNLIDNLLEYYYQRIEVEEEEELEIEE